MFLQSHPFKKKHFSIIMICLVSVGLISGCKKDNREKIDLSTIHTTVSPETMAPETSEIPITTAPKEITTSEAVKASVTAAANKAPTRSPIKNITTKKQTYTLGNISIEYPSVLNLENQTKTNAIDLLLKNNAISIIQAYLMDENQDSLTVSCQVLSADRNRITATYTGVLTKKDAPYPIRIFYSNTIDVNKEDNIEFQKFVDPYTMAGYVLSGDCMFYQATSEQKVELMKVKNDTSIDQYTQWFTNADFPYKDTFPVSFSYEHEGTIFFSIPVPHTLGDYAIVMYTPDTK